ncbi:MAG: hypothetical protein WCB99_15590 [Candidatus Cybelea sp.]
MTRHVGRHREHGLIGGMRFSPQFIAEAIELMHYDWIISRNVDPYRTERLTLLPPALATCLP